MIKKLHIERRIACPFFTGTEAMKALYCEGLSNRSLCVTRFETTESLEEWLNTVCGQTPQHCPIYQGIIKAKYDSISPPLRLRPEQSIYMDME